MDGFIFQEFSVRKSSTDEYCVLAPNLWQQMFAMFELAHVVRQQDCISFAELLHRLRLGVHTADDVKMLETRLISPEAADYPASAQRLFKTNAQVEHYNVQMYNSSTFHKVASVDPQLVLFQTIWH